MIKCIFFVLLYKLSLKISGNSEINNGHNSNSTINSSDSNETERIICHYFRISFTITDYYYIIEMYSRMTMEIKYYNYLILPFILMDLIQENRWER